MPDIDQERAHLALAERHIVEGEKRIIRQEKLLVDLQSRQQDTSEAEALLRLLRETLLTWRDHRDHILRTLNDMQD